MQAKSLVFRNIPEPLYYGLASIDDLIFFCIYNRKINTVHRVSCFQELQADSGQFRLGTSKIKSPLLKDKLNLRNDLLRAAHTAWMIYDFFKINGDNDAILNFRDKSKVQLKNDNHKQSLTDLLTTYWRVCTGCKLKSRKS